MSHLFPDPTSVVLWAIVVGFNAVFMALIIHDYIKFTIIPAIQRRRSRAYTKDLDDAYNRGRTVEDIPKAGYAIIRDDQARENGLLGVASALAKDADEFRRACEPDHPLDYIQEQIRQAPYLKHGDVVELWKRSRSTRAGEHAVVMGFDSMTMAGNCYRVLYLRDGQPAIWAEGVLKKIGEVGYHEIEALKELTNA